MLHRTGWIICVMLLSPLVAFAAEAGRRPNILFVFIDDMGYGDLSCFGNREVQTAAIDSLASEGIRFTQFYVNSPICSPSRVAVTTGQYPSRWRITSYLDTRKLDRNRGVADWLDPAAPSLAKILAEAGYYTAHVGKWHMGGHRDVGDAPLITTYGFATSLTNFEGLGERALPLFEPINGKPVKHVPTLMSAELGKGPIHWIERHKVTEVFVDRALEEIKKASARKQPFYINLWPDDVHAPVQAPPGQRGDGSVHGHYLGVLKELDRQLGRVFEFIRSDPQLRDNTIIVLASDNGSEVGLGSTGGLRGSKASLYEGGVRSPLIVWSKRIPREGMGTTDEKSVIAGMDLPPSLLKLVDVPVPATVKFDGLDRSAAFTGHPIESRSQPIMWVRPPDRPGPDNTWPDLAIRSENWKLLAWRAGSRAELFDIINDRAEARDIAKQHPDVVQRLQGELLAWDAAMNVSPRTRPRR